MEDSIAQAITDEHIFALFTEIGNAAVAASQDAHIELAGLVQEAISHLFSVINEGGQYPDALIDLLRAPLSNVSPINHLGIHFLS